MNELLIVGDDGVLTLAQDKIEEIKLIESAMNDLKERHAKYKEDLLSAMEEAGVQKFESESIRINYIDESYRETFDKKTFEKDHKDLYDKYIKISVVKPSVRIKVK